MDTKWLTVTVLVQAASILVGFVVFMLNPKAGRREFFLLGLLLLLSLIQDLVGIVFGILLRHNVNVLNSIVFPFKLSLFLLFYKNKIDSRGTAQAINAAICFLGAFALTNLLFIQKTSINSYTSVFGQVCMILISIRYFYLLILELPTESITKLPMFWINTAVLIYFSGTFFQYLAADYLVTVLNDNLINSWTLKNFVGIFYYAMLSFALWLNRSILLQVPASSANN
ncbi:MAG TPA: hypothetical protein VFE50_06520 [Cyclobacteriaceae bacterium]|nr:hypothetical protein [Cyclobacteriaceae bacterium]